MNKPIGMKVPRKTSKAADLKRTPMMNVGARLVKAVASKTTTATVLASAFFQVRCKAVSAGLAESLEHQTRYDKAEQIAMCTKDSCSYTGIQDMYSTSSCTVKSVMDVSLDSRT